MSKLSTLFVNNLVFSGVHGSTGREPLDPQRFQVDIHIDLDTKISEGSDLIQDTYDYKNASEIARYVIEKEKHVLIEKIAGRIASLISSDPKIFSVKVVVKKLDASANGIPGISVSHKRIPQESNLGILDFDVEALMKKVQNEHGVSIPILTPEYQKELLAEALSYTYQKQPEVVGPAKVREELSSTQDFRSGSLFFRLKDDLGNLIRTKLRKLKDYPFNTELSFNEMSLQLYEKGSIGITPHMDGMSCINLICVIVLPGKAKFAFCDDREGNNPRFLDTTPGNLIIFRAPGFLGSDLRPFHFLSDVTERRIVFSLRQKIFKAKTTS